MKKVLEFKISEKDAGKTIESYLKANEFSGKILATLKRTDNTVLLNDEQAPLKTVLNEGDTLKVTILEKREEQRIIPTEIPLDIIYEDDDVVVINKQADLPVHPSRRNYEHTLANALAYHYKDATSFHCITRLDKDTSGLTLVAKNRYAAAILSKQSRDKQIDKEYLAIVSGLTDKSRLIDAPIYRPTASVKRCVDFENGVESQTAYELVEYFPTKDISLVRLHPLTGRTHQIRVHMQYINHPLIGDTLYNPENTLMNRQALHAYKLRFTHPLTGTALEFTAEMPEDMKEVLK